MNIKQLMAFWLEEEKKGFSERCFDKLCELQMQIENNGFIESTSHRFLVVLRK